MPLAGETELSVISKDPQALIRIPVGAVSPLWGLFAGAAMSGAAWWWMTRWTRPANLEAVFGAAKAASEEALAEVKALSAPVVEAAEEAPAVLEAMVEAASETVGAVVEAVTLASIPDAVIDAAPEAVGGESAPISPILEAFAQDVAAPAPVEAAPEVVEAGSEPSLDAKAPPKPKKAGAPKVD
jgi:hypothetical protein